MKKMSFLFILGTAVIAMVAAGSPQVQEKPDSAKVVGAWKVEIYAGDFTYYLSLVVSEESGQLAGKVSESTGSFTDIAISNIYYDSVTFRFDFISPTPPDGMSRTVKVDFKVGTDVMEGVVTVADLDVVVDAKAARESR